MHKLSLFFNFVIFRELTGDSKFSARSLYEDNAEKELNCTIICECNQRPTLAEDVTNADVKRFIDILFGSVFTDVDKDIDEKIMFTKRKLNSRTNSFRIVIDLHFCGFYLRHIKDMLQINVN